MRLLHTAWGRAMTKPPSPGHGVDLVTSDRVRAELQKVLAIMRPYANSAGAFSDAQDLIVAVRLAAPRIRGDHPFPGRPKP